MNLRDQKGINLITLSIAIIILIIITSVLVYNSKDGTKIKTLSNLYNDIESLDKKVSSYYVEHGDLPKLGEYTNTTFISGLDAKQNNPNNAGKYYVIDLKALEGVSLNYGRDFSSVSPTDDRIVALDDIYIINEVSHTIYYPKGIDVQNVKYHTKPENWTDISLSIIPIYTAEQLSWVGDGQTHAVNGINYTFALSGTYMLKNDIDLSSVCSEASGVSWQPIGRASNSPFTGAFYGNGYEIQNIYLIKETGTPIGLGLFGYLGECTIKDLGLTGSMTTEVSSIIGGIAGVLITNKDCNIVNCYNKASISSEANSNSAGGIIGNVNGTLNAINCYNEGIVSGSNNTGGIAGYTNGTLNLQNCYNTGNITNNLGDYAGGLIGRDNAETNSTTIANSYNNGKVSGRMYNGGGLIGRNVGALNITNSYNDGEVNNARTENTGTGGILGCQNSTNNTATITNCQNHSKITADVYVGGIVGRKQNGTIENCENTGIIEETAVNSTHGNSGGIVGYNIRGIISKCKNTGEVNAKSNCIGGVCGNNHGGTVKESFNDATVTTEGASGIRRSNRISK